jgi:SAM-dependent methyltransferase
VSKNDNAYFKFKDLYAEDIRGYPTPIVWWSRLYEYPWAMQYAESGMVVADMGCGFDERPFKIALSEVCKKVYAVDSHPFVLNLTPHKHMKYVYADFTHRINAIQDESLDRIFCISVLEHLQASISYALLEFYRCLKPNGLCVVTFDVTHDTSLSTPVGGGIDPKDMLSIIKTTGFKLRKPFDFNKDDIVLQKEFNLCAFHCVLKK